VTLADRAGQLLYATPLQVYGVDGSHVPFGKSFRLEPADYAVPSAVAQQTDRIDAFLFRAPDNNLSGFVKWLDDAIKTVEEIWKALEPIIKAIGDAFSSGDYSDPENTNTTPSQSTEEALAPALGKLLTAANPAALPYDQEVTFTVSATDSNTGAAVDGFVYKSLGLPLGQGSTLLGSTGQAITATISGRWSLRPALVQAQPNLANLAMRAARTRAAMLLPGGLRLTEDEIRLTRPEFAGVDVAPVFMPEIRYVRTRDYGDVEVPFVLTGTP